MKKGQKKHASPLIKQKHQLGPWQKKSDLNAPEAGLRPRSGQLERRRGGGGGVLQWM